MKLAASDARNSAGPIISSGSAMRFIKFMVAARACDSGDIVRTMSVLVVPGANAFTRTPRWANSAAIDRVYDIMAALAAVYMAMPPENMKAPIVRTLITDAQGLAVRWGRAACTRNTGPRRLTAYDLSHASGVMWPNGWVRALAALFIRMSRRPNSSTVRSTTMPWAPMS